MAQNEVKSSAESSMAEAEISIQVPPPNPSPTKEIQAGAGSLVPLQALKALRLIEEPGFEDQFFFTSSHPPRVPGN